MKKIKLGKNIYQITIYDPLVALDRIRVNKINIYSLKKIDDYTYQFKASYFYHKKIIENVKGVKFIKREGFLGIIKNLFSSKTTIISLIIGCLCLNYFTSLILRVAINGDSKILVPLIRATLEKYDIQPYNYLISDSQLLAIETEVAKDLREKIEWIQIRKRGSLINVQFLKRRVSPQIPVNGEDLYAQKDGMIKYFRVSSGQIMVKENQYVKKGDLLISAYVDKTDGTKEWVGTRGSVYAYTWYQLTASIDQSKVALLKEDELYLLLIEQIHEQLSYIINGNDESIINEKILQFSQKESKIVMVVHYTLLEDITR